MVNVLSGHVSADTSYLVCDYPYGFRLRCKIRYWLESNNKGVRFCSQTSNPKKYHIWNKPKYSTYSSQAGAMFLDDQGHVQHAGLHEYMDTKDCVAFRDNYGAGVPADSVNRMNTFIQGKIVHDKYRAGEVTQEEYKKEITLIIADRVMERSLNK